MDYGDDLFAYDSLVNPVCAGSHRCGCASRSRKYLAPSSARQQGGGGKPLSCG